MIDLATSGRLIGIPFAIITNIRKFYPETKTILKGHLDQQRQGMRSTKAKVSDNDKRNATLTPQKNVFVGVWDPKHTAFSDQTGRFPYTSYRGNRYIMAMVEIDSSAILVELMKNRSKNR